MKKKTIWLIAGVMGFSFLALLFLQLTYMDAMIKMKKEQLDESVNKALYQAARNLELNETLKYLEKEVNETERRAYKSDSVGTRSGHPDGTVQHSHQYAVADKNGNVYSSFELKTITMRPASMPKAMILRSDKNSISEATKSMREIIKNRYVYQKALLDEVVYNILYTASDKPLKERVNFKLLDQDLKTELMNNGVSIPYHFTVSTQDGREQYRCPDYSDEGEEYSYSQTLFRNDPLNKSGIVRIHFPDMDNYIFSSVKFMIPSIAFTIVLLITFIFTIVVIFRQKRYTEIKNDFINNMTHELKTPISSISLAAQMLSDDTVTKSPVMMKHLGGVINDESKRLRFLVEKVLQMSMFDRKKAIFKKKELDLNDLAENVANTFTLRVEHTGGHIQTTGYDGGTLGDPHSGGYMTYLKDEKALHDIAKEAYSELPYFVFGHSWGSMLARAYASIYGEDIKGMMLCGVCSQWKGCEDAYVNAEFKAAYEADPYQPCGVWFERVFCGMTDRVENPNGPADWIATDPRIVEDHAGDMFNTFDTTLELCYDFVQLYHYIENDEWAAKVPQNIPSYLIAGDQDPCGNYGEGLYHVANLLAKTGHKVSVKPYPGFRHEIHNELCLRDEVEAGLIKFMYDCLA